MKKTLLILATTALLTTAYARDSSIEIVYTPPIQNDVEIIPTQNLHDIELTSIEIINKPITFKKSRIDMTKKYIKKHYVLKVKNIEIIPKIIVLHWTAYMSFEKSFKRLKAQKLFSDRKDIAKASSLNVSAHFLVDRDGTIYRLMPETTMARHVIGLNHAAIGIENVGGTIDLPLTEAQVQSNIWLVKYLASKYEVEYVIGHYEYTNFVGHELWLEKDEAYRTEKTDPGVDFINAIRKKTSKQNWKPVPQKK
jgi:N-acetylmuramoyl-L-alanine amidase